jgi:hypothetical protein
MTFLSPDDYERIERLEADIKAAKADIEAFRAAHPSSETGENEEAKTLAQKQDYLHRLGES